MKRYSSLLELGVGRRERLELCVQRGVQVGERVVQQLPEDKRRQTLGETLDLLELRAHLCSGRPGNECTVQCHIV